MNVIRRRFECKHLKMKTRKTTASSIIYLCACGCWGILGTAAASQCSLFVGCNASAEPQHQNQSINNPGRRCSNIASLHWSPVVPLEVRPNFRLWLRSHFSNSAIIFAARCRERCDAIRDAIINASLLSYLLHVDDKQNVGIRRLWYTWYGHEETCWSCPSGRKQKEEEDRKPEVERKKMSNRGKKPPHARPSKPVVLGLLLLVADLCHRTTSAITFSSAVLLFIVVGSHNEDIVVDKSMRACCPCRRFVGGVR